ncbi:peptidoglycan DD-metalloendopeptidase family protein [Antarcticirhabdus aurantiaca]|uniref:Peptidoglycan DD-metalloendopeptidase family protein n=1 Tax=Antarcticirhabdus aurantiaca TaxID=2606717 RepID=A0ACD4NWM5_9HYPH|nr:peptidoglycan DD-metalloendopeptidase family protein [Antarcticirhabdus aurantiaca]WAJ31123.1 peptidoglycan DD-metalloendopeptidase family protein [Jeongeuplla avenae]
MRDLVLSSTRRKLCRSAAALTLSAFAAGCSADIARFDDGFYTGAVPQQPQQMQAARGPAAQAYPGSVDQMNTGSVSPREMQPTYSSAPTQSVSRSSLPPPAPAAGGMPSATAAAPLPPAPPTVAAATPPSSGARSGWSGSSASLTLQPGETVHAVAQRFNVPVESILAANNISDPSQVRPGQSILIPNYDYGRRAPASAATTVASAAPAGRGAPPSTLGAQASALAVPRSAGARPAATASASVGPATRGVPGPTVTVAAGDSLNAIARRAGVSVAALRQANNITGDNIRAGQTLRVPMGGTQMAALPEQTRTPTMPAPTMSDAPVAAAAMPAAAAPDTGRGGRVAATPSAAAEAPKPAPAAAAPAPAAVASAPAPAASEPAKETQVAAIDPKPEPEASAAGGSSKFRWPVQGRVVKGFGDKVGNRRNDGLDISVPQGTPIKAADNGVVIYAGDGLKEFGNTVLVRHDNGLVTVYGHADQINVKRGASVKRGESIATAGMSGDTDVPKVHFEVRKDSSPVDPMTFLR